MMVPVTLMIRNSDSDGGADEWVRHKRIGAEITDTSIDDPISYEGEVRKRTLTMKVVNSPLIQNLPKEIDGVEYGGQRWRIESKQVNRPTDPYALLICSETASR